MSLKQSFLCVFLYILSSLFHITASGETNKANNVGNTPAATDAEAYIQNLYKSIDFHNNKVDADVFHKAMVGYLNLRNAGKMKGAEILTIADFSKSSTANRLWIIDLAKKKVVYNTYVAHGQGSGDDYARVFSNVDGTHASSLGFYVTGDTYIGQHGRSLRLNGMDQGYNNAALSRGIVVHAADYVNKGIIQAQGRLGRSWGCPALAPELAQPIIDLIKGGTCLFIYAPQKDYLAKGYWLNKKVERLPGVPQNFQLADASLAAPSFQAPAQPKPMDTVFMYNGKVVERL